MATMELEDPSGYGRVVRGAEGSVERVVETKAPGDATDAELAIREVNTGVYAFDGGALVAALAQLESGNAQGELYLPDVLPRMREAGRTIEAHVVTDWTLTVGVNDRVDLAHARELAQRRIHEAHMRAGVTIVDPRRDDDRRRRRDRPGHGDRAGLLAAAGARASARAARSAR